MNKILLTLLFLVSTVCWSQRKIIKKFNLTPNPKLHLVDSQFVDESLITILDYKALNSKAGPYVSPYEVITTHKIIKVQDDVGIKVANSLSIPIGKEDKLLKLKVRTISPKGEVTNFDIENLVELETEEGYNIKKFAIQGVQKGGEIEYLYCVKRALRSFGRIYYSSPYPIQTLKFELFNPSIGYKIKTYNGLPKVKSTYNSHLIEDHNLLPFTKEGLSSNKAKIKRIDYKITQFNGQDVGTKWKTLGNTIYEGFTSKKGGGKIKSFLKPLNLGGLTNEEKIVIVENEIKNSIVFEENNFTPSVHRSIDPYGEISSILKTKLANTKGMFRFYLKCFEILGIPVDVLLASSRYEGSIDEDFAHSMDLRTPLLFFKNINKYIDPIDKTMRLGVPSAEFGDSRALRIKPSNTQFYSKYETSFIRLPILKFDENRIGTVTKVALNDSQDGLDIKLEQSYTGYRAFNSRYAANEMKDDDNFNAFLINGIDDLKINSYVLENENIEDSYYSKKPFIIKGKLESESLVENLGDDILVHLGKLIGKQTKLYKEKNRTNDVILRNGKHYDHKIEFVIPEGYQCNSLTELPKDLKFIENGIEHLFFNISYTLVENVLTIHIKEGYNTILIEKKNYEDYRSVVNGAADFNSFVLVLEII